MRTEYLEYAGPNHAHYIVTITGKEYHDQSILNTDLGVILKEYTIKTLPNKSNGCEHEVVECNSSLASLRLRKCMYLIETTGPLESRAGLATKMRPDYSQINSVLKR